MHVKQLSCQPAIIRRVVHARFMTTAKFKRVFGLRLDRQASLRGDVELGLLGLARHLLASRSGNRLTLGGRGNVSTAAIAAAAAVAGVAAAIAAVVMEEAAELA